MVGISPSISKLAFAIPLAQYLHVTLGGLFLPVPELRVDLAGMRAEGTYGQVARSRLGRSTAGTGPGARKVFAHSC